MSGSPQPGQPFATGDAVNVAARLEQAAAPGQVLVGERTATLVGDAFEFGEPSTVEAKGKKDGVVCARTASAWSRPAAHAAATASWVRSSAASASSTGYSRLSATDEPRFALVVGEPGRRQDEHSCGSCGNACPLGRPSGSAAASPTAAASRTARSRTCSGRSSGLTGGGSRAREDRGQRDPRADAWGSTSPATSSRVRPCSRLQDAVGAPRVGHWGCAARPSSCVEDLHWATEPLIELLARVLSDAAGPVLILGTTRPGRSGLPAPARR